MNKSKTFFILTISILSISFFTSCGAIVKGMANKHITEEKGAIPPDFGKENTTILFITHHKSYNKYLKKNVKKLYKGEYEFVSEEEFESNEKYKNLNKYRFIFDYSYRPAGSVWKTSTINSGSHSITTTRNRPALYSVKKFTIVDRKAEKIYKSRLTSSMWSKLQKIYLKKLNEKLISEQN